MECTYCNSDLEDNGAWGYLAAHQSGEVLGRTYTCNNADGFESKDKADEYQLSIGEEVTEDWESICCDSCTHNASGSFYTDKNGNLNEGYPC